MITADNYYPNITIKRIENPNRLYAFPILGGLFKIIILIPVLIVIFVLSLASLILTFINSFIVLFTRKYWRTAFDLNTALFKLNTKTMLFQKGLTDTYPGFSSDIKDNYSIDINYPETSNRLFAIPLLGGIARIILIIPFFIFLYILQLGGSLASIIASFPVLFNGYYPESLHEFIRDYLRIQLAASMYLCGISDRYPSFSISMNHKKIKIIFIAIPILYLTLSLILGAISPKHTRNTQPFQNYYYSMPTPTMSFSNPQY